MTALWYNNRANKKATALFHQPVAWPQPSSDRSDMPTIPHAPGVYKITCTANHKVYIGSTTKIRKRWGWHRNDLRRGVHHNRHLQFAWNKYGEHCFEFEILEMVMFAEHLHEREQYWLDQYQAFDPDKGFNHGKVARAPWLGRSHSDETKQKLSDKAKANDTTGYARPFADEWHGSAAGIAWHREHGKSSWDGRVAATKSCEQCGAAFQTRDMRESSRFCSSNCKMAARRARKADHETRICATCEEAFTCNKHFSTRCCSLSCAAKLRWRLRLP